MSLSNQSYEIQPSSINLHPNEYNQELDCYPFAVKLDKCVGSCDTLNDLSTRICVPNKTRFKYTCFYHDYRKKWIKNFNKRYIMQM